MIKNIFKVITVLLMIAGAIWFLQGVNILPGSFMTGDPQWAINGAIMIVVGGVVFWFLSRKNK